MVKVKIIKNSVIAIGNFDGIHKGHQDIFSIGKKIAKQRKKKFGVLTFSPMPSEFFQKEKKNLRITSDDIKIDLFKKNKIDFFYICKFNKQFSLMKPESFIKKILVNKLGVDTLIVGKNFKFGHKREGTISLLKKYGKIYNYKVLDRKLVKANNKKISSTRVRSEILNGNFQLVTKFLDREWSIREKVIRGKKIGRSIGFRTANVAIERNIYPKIGVYAVRILVNKKRYKGVANFGFAPTFSRNKLVLEINFFNKIKALYGKIIEVFFVKYIRNEKKFKNTFLLIQQIKKDINMVKNILNT